MAHQWFETYHYFGVVGVSFASFLFFEALLSSDFSCCSVRHGIVK
jgi:hypothetical protein